MQRKLQPGHPLLSSVCTTTGRLEEGSGRLVRAALHVCLPGLVRTRGSARRPACTTPASRHVQCSGHLHDSSRASPRRLPESRAAPAVAVSRLARQQRPQSVHPGRFPAPAHSAERCPGGHQRRRTNVPRSHVKLRDVSGLSGNQLDGRSPAYEHAASLWCSGGRPPILLRCTEKPGSGPP